MTIRQIEIFQSIVKNGGFTSASRALHLAQPSVSQQVRQLEQELGLTLFHRLKNRRVALTEGGKLFYAHAETILRQCQVARMEVTGLITDPSGVVRVGIGQNQLSVLLPNVLQQFHQKYPRICVDIVHGNTPMLVDLLRMNQLDLGVISVSELSHDLKTRPMFAEEMMVVVHQSNPLAHRTEIRLQELAGVPLVLYDETMSVGNQIEEFFRQEQFTPTVILRLNSANTLKLMIEKRIGATIAPTSDLLFPHRRTPLRAVRLRGSPLQRTVALATPPLARLPQVAETLLDLILKESRSMPLLHGSHL